MVDMYKALVEEFDIEAETHAHDAWWKKVVWTYRLLSILLDNLKVDVFKIIFDHCLGGKSVALRVAEGARQEGFMGGPAKAAIQIDRDPVE